jgi:ribosomal-protein-alanine N-acetyltransferase
MLAKGKQFYYLSGHQLLAIRMSKNTKVSGARAMEQIHIRYFHPEDLQRVIFINRNCLPENYPGLFFMSIYESFPRAFIVAEDIETNLIIGYVMGRVERGFSSLKSYKLTKKGHIVSIAVMEEYRRKGIAQRLMEEALHGFREYEASESFLEVRESNIEAVNLYEKLGYVKKKILPGYYRDGEDALLFTCPL